MWSADIYVENSSLSKVDPAGLMPCNHCKRKCDTKFADMLRDAPLCTSTRIISMCWNM